MANPFTSSSASFGLTGDYDTEQKRLDYERQMAQRLAADDQTPTGRMVGRIFVPPSITQYMAQALNPMMARNRMDALDQRQQQINDARNTERVDTLGKFSQALAGKPEEALPPDVFGPPAPAVPGDKNAALSILGKSRDPLLQSLYLSQMTEALKPKKPIVVGRTLMDEAGNQIGVDSTWQAEQQAAREARKAELEAKLADQRTSREEQAALRRELAANASADRRMIAGMVNARQEQKNVPKLPTSALKMQQEELDAIGTSSTINADLGALDKQIEDGKLKLGMVDNLAAKAKNFVGASDESSRNLASFQATLEKLRNDSLRLNKGVQTEGDAQRAWNELVANINDPKLVRQRLGEIQKINQRAANLRRMNIDAIRSNFGVEPMDVGGSQNQPAAGGGGSAPNVDDLLKKYGG